MYCTKAYSVINRIFSCFTNNVTTILTAYIAYARPHLEFASTLWNPGIDLIMIYTLINGLIDIDPSSLIQIKTNNITRGHSKELLIYYL